MKRLIWSAIIIVVIFFLVKAWWNNQLAQVSSDKSTQIFVIDKEETFSKIVKKLKTQKLIRSDWAFTILAKQSGQGVKIQEGTFRLSPSFSAGDILNILTSQPLDNWVTIL